MGLGDCILCWMPGDLGRGGLGDPRPPFGFLERESALAWAGVRIGPRLGEGASRGDTATQISLCL